MQNELRRAVDAIPGLVWSAGADGRVDFLNQRWCDYTGISLPDACGTGWQAAIHPDDLPGLLAAWRSLLESGHGGEFEARLRRFDGAFRWFLIRAVPLRDEAGRLVKWYGQNTDIEDRKRAEALLAGEKRLLEMIAGDDSLPLLLEGVCQLVEEAAPGSLCGILLVDPAGREVHHGAAPNLPGTYNEAMHGRPARPEAGPCGMAACLKEQVIVADIASDPRWGAHEWRTLALAHGLKACWSTPIVSSEGGVLGTFALYWRQAGGGPTVEHQNVIERMTHLAAVAVERGRTAAALQESEQRLRLMADATPEVIWLTALHPETVLYASPSFEHLWGLPLEDLYRNPRLWTETIHPDDRARVVETFTRWITRDGVNDYDIEFRIIHPSGAVRWIHERGAVILDGGGAPYRVSGISTDITERKRAEASLNQVRSELAHVARVATLGALTASIAHEINQPLSGIITNASTSLRMLADDPPNIDGARETARRTIRDANRAAEVIARLRALFKKTSLSTELLDLNEATREVLTLLSSELQRSRAIVRTELADRLPLVSGDRVQLQQVVLNLVLNAAEAMSMIDDRPRYMTIRTECEEPDRVRLAVQDAGPGFDQETAGRLFDTFFTTKRDGMGIGLSISRSIIENHQGRLWAIRNDGPGSTFMFSIPRLAVRAPRGNGLETTVSPNAPRAAEQA